MTEIKNEELKQDSEIRHEPETETDSEIKQDSEITADSEIAQSPESTKDPEIVQNYEDAKNPEIVQDSEKAKDSEIELNSEDAKDSDVVQNFENAKDSEIAQNSENAKDSEIAQKSDTEEQSSDPNPSETPLLTKKQKKHAAIQAPPEGEYGDGAYNYKTIYTSKIEPHVKEILLLCDQYHIPAFMTFAISNNKEETKYASEVLSEVVEGRELTKDVISKHVLVMSGFDVVPEYEEMIVEELL